MKQICQWILIFFAVFLVFSFSITSAPARLLPVTHRGEQVNTNGMTHAAGSSSVKIQEEEEEDLFNLMGLEEECEDKRDEDCIKRRMTAEAHLDYIYTQHHRPKATP